MFACGKKLLLATLIITAWLAGCRSVPKQPETEAPVDPFAQAAQYEFGQSRAPLSGLEEQIRAASAQERARIEKKLLKILESLEATYAGKQFCCRMLRRIGTEQSVPVLAWLLFDDQMHDSARFALQGMDCPEAGKALRDALPQLKDDAKIGVIDTLARRNDRMAVPLLAGLLKSDDQAVVQAALSALGRIGGTEAAHALIAARVKWALRTPRAHAYLDCADRLLAEGKVQGASAMYLDMTEAFHAAPIQLGTWHGKLKAKPDQADQLFYYIFQNQPDLNLQAAHFLSEFVHDSDLSMLINAMPELNHASKIVLMANLSFHGVKAALPAVVDALEYTDKSVRVEALRALRFLGDERHVESISRFMDKEGEEATAAAYTLERLQGEAIDSSIALQMDAANAKQRAALIRCLVARRSDQAVELLLESAIDSDAEVRRAALAGLGELAQAEDLSMFLMVLDTLEEEDLDQAEDALFSLCDRMEDREMTVAALAEGFEEKKAPVRAMLLSVMGRLPCEEALKRLNDATEDSEEAVRLAAVESLSQWPDIRPIDVLRDTSRNAGRETERALALDGYLRMIEMDEERTAEQVQEAYEESIDLARSVEEKATIIERASGLTELWVLDFLEPLLQDDQLKLMAQEAERKVCGELARKVSHDAQGCPVTLAFPYREKYNGGHENALTDGKWGSTSYGDGCWQGFDACDLDAVIDLGSEVEVKSIRAGFLSDINSWIFPPIRVEFSLSMDGENFEVVAAFDQALPEEIGDASLEGCFTRVDSRTARYVRVVANNIMTCPDWHPGAGGDTWIFADEIQVNPHFGR